MHFSQLTLLSLLYALPTAFTQATGLTCTNQTLVLTPIRVHDEFFDAVSDSIIEVCNQVNRPNPARTCTTIQPGGHLTCTSTQVGGTGSVVTATWISATGSMPNCGPFFTIESSGINHGFADCTDVDAGGNSFSIHIVQHVA